MRITITLNDQVADALEAAAAAEKRSVSSFVALLIEREFEARRSIKDVRDAAEAAALVATPERVLAVLTAVKSEAYATAEGDR